jgi:NNP family nitrate/nitrite transporter-like MFS transporter
MRGLSTEAERYPKYRWVVLGVAWLTLLCLYWSWFLIPSLASRLSSDLGLSHLQYTLIFTAPVMMGIWCAITAGAAADRFGIRRVVAIAAFLGGAGGLARAFAPNFEVMFILTCLVGIAAYGSMSNLPKLVAIWFPPRQAGVAAGIYSMSIGLGLTLGLFTAPLFPDWQTAFTVVGIITLVAACLWVLLARNAPKGVKINMPPMISGIKRGLRSRNILLVCVVYFLFMGTFTAFSGNFPEALELIHNMSPATAGTITALFTGGGIVGNLLVPTLSDRLGLRKPFIYASVIIIPVCLFFAWQLAPSVATWVLVLAGGLGVGTFPPVILTLPLELPEIGQEHVGGATGLMIAAHSIGGTIIPLFVISPIVAAGTAQAYSTGFLVMMVLLVAAIIPTLFLRETGRRGRG